MFQGFQGVLFGGLKNDLGCHFFYLCVLFQNLAVFIKSQPCMAVFFNIYICYYIYILICLNKKDFRCYFFMFAYRIKT